MFFHFDHPWENSSHAEAVAIGRVHSCEHRRDQIIVHLPAEAAAKELANGFVFWRFRSNEWLCKDTQHAPKSQGPEREFPEAAFEIDVSRSVGICSKEFVRQSELVD